MAGKEVVTEVCPAKAPKKVKASIFEQSSVRFPNLKGRDYEVPVVQWPYRTHFRLEDDDNHVCARVEVTPELALSLLAYNSTNNRNVKRNAIEKYARMMRQGKWVYSPQGIVFGDNARLIDGQNRLYAVVLSGKVTPFRITLGWDKEVMNALDRGAMRLLMDAIKVEELNMSKMEVAILRGAVRYGHNIHEHNQTPLPTWLELCKEHKPALETVNGWFSTGWADEWCLASVRSAVFHATLTLPNDRLKDFVQTVLLERQAQPGEGAARYLQQKLPGYYADKKKKRNEATHRNVYLKTSHLIQKFLKKIDVSDGDTIRTPDASPFPAFTRAE